MNGTICFTVCSLFYSVLLLIVFFKKKVFSSFENKIYEGMIISNFIGCIVHILCGFISPMRNNSFLSIFMTKIFLIYLITWILLIVFYVFVITFFKKGSIEDNKKILFFGILILFIYVISTITVLSLGIDIHNDGSIIYVLGDGIDFVYTFSAICVCILVLSLLLNIKHIINKKYIPVFVFILIGSVVMAIQTAHPELLLIAALQTYIDVIMYFTLENPDTKMLDEYRRNREYADATNREKAVFLFNITQDIRKPLNEIGEACNELSLMTNNKEINKGINYIDSTSRNLLGFVNGVLDISNLETCNIKVYNTKYNPTLILNELVKSAKETINKDVDFRVNIDKSIPELLYGDSMRIKQVIKTLLDNASKYTKEGYIELNVHEIRKESLCRLLITVEDSGSGIKADEYALIFDKNREDDEVHKIDDSKNNLAVAKTVATLLGGLLTFTTSIGEGTKFTFILDQKMVEDTSKEFKQIEKYTQAITKPTVIVVSEDEEYLSTAVKKISKYDLDVTGSNLGAKCIEKIRHNVKCDYILLDEDLLTLDIYEVLTKLKEIKDFHSKVYVLSRNTDNLKLIKNGFDKVISRKIKGSEISELEKDE